MKHLSTSIIRLCLLAVLALGIASSALAQTASEYIAEHRTWMHANYPKAEDLSLSQRLREAAFAVFDELRESEAMALLHAVGKEIKVVDDYATFEESGEKDYLFTHSLCALEALYTAAERQLGTADATTGWCKYLWLTARSNMEDIYPLMDAAIAAQKKAASASADKEVAALLCLFKLLKFEASANTCCIPSPDLYDEVLQTEKDAVKLYPIADKTPSHMRAWLYMTMGKVKNQFSAYHESSLAYSKAGLIGESFYGHNVNTGILHNAEHYFTLAEDAYLQLYKPGHPEVIAFYTAMEIARENYNAINDDNVEVAETLYDYAAKYYGQGHITTILSKLSYWEVQASRGREVKDAFMWHTMKESMERYLGDNNINYTYFFASLIEVVSLYSPSDLDEASQAYDQSVARTCGTDNMKAALLHYHPYGGMKDLHPELFEAKAVPQIDFYTHHHDKSWWSIVFGRRLALDLYVSMRNLKRGTEIQQMVCEDVEQHYGTHSYVYLQEKAKALNWLASYDADAARPQYPSLIRQMKEGNIDYTDVLGDYATLENGSNNIKRAAQLYQQAYDESAEDGDTPKRAYFLLSKLSVMPYLKSPRKDQEEVYETAKTILDNNRDTLQWLTINYSLAADWLTSQKRYKEALAMLNRGIDICNWRDDGFTSDYTSLLTQRYKLYMYQLDDMSTAYKLMEQDVEAFEKQNFNYYNVDMLDYLWTVYELSPKSMDDLTPVLKYLNLIMKMTGNIGQQSNQEPNFLSVYGVKMLREMVNLGIYVGNLKKQINMENLPEKQRQYIETAWASFDGMLDNLVDAESLLDNLKAQIPHYEQHSSYFSLLSTLENIFIYLRPDREKALKYLNLHLEQSKKLNSSEAVNASITLFDFYAREHEYTKAETLYLKELKPVEDDNKQAESAKLPLYDRMCNLYMEQRDFKDMLPYARKFYQSMKKILNNNFQLFTEQEQTAFMNNYGDPASWLSCCMAGLADKKEAAKEVYDAVLYRTGMQLRSQSETRKAILKSNDKELIALVDSVRILRLRQQEVDYDITSESQESLNKKYAEVADYQSRINRLERDIMERSAAYRNKTPLNATWSQVSETLKQGEAAIEFIYAYPYWMALVVKPGCLQPAAISLVRTDTLTAKMSALNANTPTAMARQLYNSGNCDLYAMLWQPLEAELKDVSKVYYATQGVLSAIAFAAIRTPDGQYLIDRYDLCPLTTTAQLLHNENEQQPKSMLLLGDIYYSDKQKEQVSQGDTASARGDDDLSIDDFSDRGAKRYHFKYLPFTRTEIEDLKETFHGRDVWVQKGAQATEESLRRQLKSKPDIVHLATHGFFIASDVAAQSVPFYKRHSRVSGNSMQRAGVALAGAEDTWNGTKTPEEDNDGILTANEVAQTDLHGTQLVTLSACETALGDYTFEGVFGLPRGFKQAGVKSLLVSLWSVNDKSTALLMTAFYRYWMQGQTKHEAFRHAVSDVRKDYPEPYYWAPFLLLDALK